MSGSWLVHPSLQTARLCENIGVTCASNLLSKPETYIEEPWMHWLASQG